MTGLEFTLVLMGAITLVNLMMRFVRFIETGK